MTATATAATNTRNLLPIHGACALWIGSMFFLSAQQPAFYDAILQEDRFVEWLTAALFIAAGAVRITSAIRQRNAFDVLVGIFCIFVGGEEFSWGQRLLGFTPPDTFLEHNTQQEFTLHNFADVFGKPKGMLILSLLGFGLLLPLLDQFSRTRALLARIGATAPRPALAGWLVAAAGLLVWYPVDLTGEWTEALAGFLFLASAPVAVRPRLLAGSLATASAIALTLVSAQPLTGGRALAQCARMEMRALLEDIAGSLEDYPDLRERRVHKRVFTAIEDGYVDPILPGYRKVHCDDDTASESAKRRRYVIDPWGMAYWVRSRPGASGVTITVYTFGANRKRDIDDLAATVSSP